LEDLETSKHALDNPSTTEQPPKPVVPAQAPSFRCRELYNGSKFYWRLQDTIEYHVYLHLESNCVEVIPYGNHKQVEYTRLYFAEEKLYTLVGPEKIAEKVKLRLQECENKHPTETLPKEEDLLADERRQCVVSLLMSKLQLSIPNPETKVKVVSFKMIVDAEANPELSSAPASVQPVLVKRRRLSTTEEIEAALLEANDMELKINVALTEAEQLENLAHGTVKS
jgi:hypothetical protein